MSESDDFADGTRRAIEIVEERKKYIIGYSPRSESHERQLDARAKELQFILNRLREDNDE